MSCFVVNSQHAVVSPPKRLDNEGRVAELEDNLTSVNKMKDTYDLRPKHYYTKFPHPHYPRGEISFSFPPPSPRPCSDSIHNLFHNLLSGPQFSLKDPGKARHSLDVVVAALSVKRFARGRSTRPPELVTAAVGSLQQSATVPIRKSAVVLAEKSISCNIQDENQPIPKNLAQKGGEFTDSDLLERCELNVESSSKKEAVNLAFDKDSIMEIDLTDKKESSKECGGVDFQTYAEDFKWGFLKWGPEGTRTGVNKDMDNYNDIIRHG
ncbi:hypothetical protein LguiA_008981 [Lonicera macranthoides]